MGTILGWGLNYLNDKKQKKLELCFALQPSPNSFDDNINEELKTKYSESGYCLCCYNIGQTPYLFESISLKHNNRIITECYQTEVAAKVIMPYEHFIYEFNMQEYKSIQNHCRKQNLKKCKIIAIDISGKTCMSYLDLSLPFLQTNKR